MKSVLKYAGALALSCLAIESAARTVGYSPGQLIKPYKRAPLQDIVSFGCSSVVSGLCTDLNYRLLGMSTLYLFTENESSFTAVNFIPTGKSE
jgi:hypothetical protein